MLEDSGEGAENGGGPTHWTAAAKRVGTSNLPGDPFEEEAARQRGVLLERLDARLEERDCLVGEGLDLVASETAVAYCGGHA